MPSKAMIATGEALTFMGRAQRMGLTVPDAGVDPEALRERIVAIEARLQRSVTDLLESQGVRMVRTENDMTLMMRGARDRAAFFASLTA